MRPRARRARAILRCRRRGYWPAYLLMSRCTGYDLYMISWLRGNGPLLDPGKMQAVFLDSI